MQIELSHDHQDSLREAVQKGVDDANAGRTRPLEDVISEIRTKLLQQKSSE